MQLWIFSIFVLTQKDGMPNCNIFFYFYKLVSLEKYAACDQWLQNWYFWMIVAVSIHKVIISFTVRSIILWQSRYFSMSGIREAEVVPSVNFSGEIAPFVPFPQPYKIPLQFFASPPTGDSTCPAHCSPFLKEIPNFISELRLVSSSVSISQLCPGALVSYIWFCIVPLDMFS